ncbi:serine hydrolase domain-containing protein [Photobacterium minamisatsumaniensis]|uniref:serine hydrolase domain-containing protein n=1 Tax=Photobacterium minamisatsumaniensis TaxID=2910233 RepID=UPI003D119EF7
MMCHDLLSLLRMRSANGYRSTKIGAVLVFSMALPVKAQDGLSDEEVTLNHITATKTESLSHVIKSGSTAYSVPAFLNDGIFTENIHDASINVDGIEQLRQKIAAGDFGQIDSLLIHHQGKLISEDYWNDGAINKPHFMFSITKNMLSNAIGKAIELGYIDSVNDPAIKYLSNIDKEKLATGSESITLHDLLSMQSGLSIPKHTADHSPITADNHAELYLTLSDNVEPGKHFKYQGADTDILNHVLYNTTGKDLAAFTNEHFFKPMLITNAYWETSACGLTKASSGLHMTSRDMLKFGMLLLGKGQFNSEQLLTKEWLHTATTPKTRNGNYGYFWWTQNFRLDGKELKTISARGARGQFIFVNPELDLIVAVTSSNTGQQRRVPLQFVPEYILPAIPPTK